jgi:hypothetical protein
MNKILEEEVEKYRKEHGDVDNSLVHKNMEGRVADLLKEHALDTKKTLIPNIVGIISSSEKLNIIVSELSEKICNLERIDVNSFQERLKEAIISNRDNYTQKDVDLDSLTRSILLTTIEQEVSAGIRILSLMIKQSQ